MTLGQIAYEALWKSLYPDVPIQIKFDTLNENTQLAWEEAAKAVTNHEQAEVMPGEIMPGEIMTVEELATKLNKPVAWIKWLVEK